MMEGALIVSIDFELNWGYTDKKRPLNLQEVEAGLQSLKQLLDKYEIHSTWATVGQLFSNKFADSESNDIRMQDNLYQHYDWIKDNLISDPKVEIGSHTFEHVFLEEVSRQRANQDFINMQNQGLSFETIVYPRNQYSQPMIKLSKEYGVRHFRSVKKNWYLQSSKFTHENKLKQLLKRATELLPINRPVEIEIYDKVIGISDSRFFRFFPKGLIGDWLTKWYLWVLKYELRSALKNKQTYHIWFHPHNLIVRPGRIAELEAFFQYFKHLQNTTKAESLTLAEYAARLK